MSNGLCLKYFVLNPTKKNIYGEASRVALIAYAEFLDHDNIDRELVRDIQSWVKAIEDQWDRDEQGGGLCPT